METPRVAPIFEARLCSSTIVPRNVCLRLIRGTPGPFVPKSLRQAIFKSLHDISYPGIRTTHQLLAQPVYAVNSPRCFVIRSTFAFLPTAWSLCRPYSSRHRRTSNTFQRLSICPYLRRSLYPLAETAPIADVSVFSPSLSCGLAIPICMLIHRYHGKTASI